MARRVTTVRRSWITVGSVAGVFALEHVRDVAPLLVSLSPRARVPPSSRFRLLGVRVRAVRCEVCNI